MRAPILTALVTLAGCASGDADPDTLAFARRRPWVGFPTAAVRIVDVDADGRPDVLAAGGGGVAFLRGDGSGGLELDTVLEAGPNPVHLAVGDLDEDGRLDVAVANHDSPYVTLLFGVPGGPGPVRTVRLRAEVSPHPHAVALRDVDGDGHLDLLVDDRDAEALRVFLGRGDGRLEPGPAIAVGGDPYRGMEVVDVTGDGLLDVVTPNPGSVAIQRGGKGAFSPGAVLAYEGFRPFSVATGDFDGDGRRDVGAGSGEGDGAALVWLADEAGGFRLEAGSPHVIADGPTATAAADVDGDGVDDLVLASYMGDEVAVLLGGPGPLRVVRIALPDRPWGVAAGDLDGDGRIDLVTGHDAGDRITVLLNRDPGASPATAPPGTRARR